MPKRNIIWIAAIVIATVVTVWVTRRSEPLAVDTTPKPLRPVVDTYRLIEDKYYGPLDRPKLRRKAVAGMVSALDSFSSYVPPEKLAAFKRHMEGKDCGVGLRLEMAGGKVVVVGALPNSPAHAADVRAGDQVLAVDGLDLAGLELDEVELLLEGQVGSEVELTVMRRREKLNIHLTRAEFPIETVTGLYRGRRGQWVHYLDDENGLAYVRISEFVEHTGSQFQPVCRRLGRPKGFVLDLRDNPGGHLAAAVPVADIFLAKGVIVTEVRREGPPKVHLAHAEGTYHPVPLVVLINGRTASAAEIVAGALGMRGRAVLVGAPTRGKHCVQTMYSLSGGLGQVNLTTSQFLVGSARAAGSRRGDDWRIEPHVEVLLSAPERRELLRLRMRAQVVPARAPAGGPAETPRKEAAPPIARQIVRMDLQLAEAVKLLRNPKKMEAILEEAAGKTAATRRVRVRSVPVGDHD